MNFKTVLLATCALAIATPALAQKSKDTLRIAFYQPVRLVDTYYEGGPEGTVANRMVFDNLVNFDESKKEYIAVVAE